jgi:hypothetical protein
METYKMMLFRLSPCIVVGTIDQQETTEMMMKETVMQKDPGQGA